jgi:uncharacterized membrane protein YraQ (UPF0718 family)
MALLAIAGIPALLFPSRTGHFFNILLGLTIEVLPFILIGAGFAALIANWNKGRRWFLQRIAKSRFRAALAGLGMGFAMPVCECGAASVARQADREGAPVSLTIVFLLAAPILNPVTIFVTWLAFGSDWLIVLGRVGLGLVIALGIGVLFSLHPHPAELFNRKEQGHSHSHHNIDKRGAFPVFLDKTIIEFIEAFRTVLPGLALASAFQAYAPGKLFTELGQGALFSALVLMALAFLMSSCSSVDAFIVLAFAGLFPSGALLAFLVFGPLVNLKSLFLMRMVLSWRAIGLIALLTSLVVLLSAVVVNLRWS